MFFDIQFPILSDLDCLTYGSWLDHIFCFYHWSDLNASINIREFWWQIKKFPVIAVEIYDKDRIKYILVFQYGHYIVGSDFYVVLNENFVGVFPYKSNIHCPLPNKNKANLANSSFCLYQTGKTSIMFCLNYSEEWSKHQILHR